MNPSTVPPDLYDIGGHALREVLDIQLSVPITRVSLAPSADAAGAPLRILGSVKLIGERVSGSVHVLLPEPFARHAARLLFGDPGGASPTDTVINDLTGELCNMIAGRVAANLSEAGYPSVLDTPLVVRGAPRLPEAETGVDCSRTLWSCEGHLIALEVQCHFRPI